MPLLKNIIRNKRWTKIVNHTENFKHYNNLFHNFLFNEEKHFFSKRVDLYNRTRKLLLEIEIFLQQKLEEFPDNYARKFIDFYDGKTSEVQENFNIINDLKNMKKTIRGFYSEYQIILDTDTSLSLELKNTISFIFSFYTGTLYFLIDYYEEAKDEFIRNKAYDEDLEFLKTWPSDDTLSISKSEAQFKISYTNSIRRRRKCNYQPTRSYFKPIKYGWN